MKLITPQAVPEVIDLTQFLPQGWHEWSTGDHVGRGVVTPEWITTDTDAPPDPEQWRVLEMEHHPERWKLSPNRYAEWAEQTKEQWLEGADGAGDMLLKLPISWQVRVMNELGYSETAVGARQSGTTTPRRELVRTEGGEEMEADHPDAFVAQRERWEWLVVPNRAGRLVDDERGGYFRGQWVLPEAIRARGTGDVPEGWTELDIDEDWRAESSPLPMTDIEAFNVWDRVGECCSRADAPALIPGWQ